MDTKHILIALAALALFGCDKQGATDDANAPKETATARSAATKTTPAPDKADEKAEEKESAAKPPHLMDLVLHPHTEEYSGVEISWKGEDGEASLHKEPRADAPVAAKLALKKGAVIDWEKTNTNVIVPDAFRATETIAYKGYSVVDPETKALEDEPKEHSFAKGDIAYGYHYAGEGTCYVGWKAAEGDVFALGNCLDDSAQGWEKVSDSPARQTQWFVLVKNKKGERGWLLVDEEQPFEVKQLSTLEGE